MYAGLLADLWRVVWADSLGPSPPALPPLANRCRRIYGAPMGFVAWTTPRWGTQHLGAATHASYASCSLMH